MENTVTVDTLDNKVVTNALDKGYLSTLEVSRQYTEILRQLKKSGCQFNQIPKRMQQHAKDSGAWKSTFTPKGEKWKTFKDALESRELWAKKIDLFCKWVKRTHVSFDKLKADVPKEKSTADLKEKEYKKRISAVQVLIEMMSEMDNSVAVAHLKAIKALITR